MKNIFNIFGKILLFLLMLFFIFLVCVQYINYNNINSLHTSNNNFFSFLNSGEPTEKGIIILKNLNKESKNVSVLINGEYVCDFSKNNEAKIYVYNNDIVEIYNKKNNKDIYIQVVEISNNVFNPNLNDIIKIPNGIVILSRVQLK